MALNDLEQILETYEKYNTSRYSLVSLNEIFLNVSIAELTSLCKLHGIPTPSQTENEKMEIIINVLTFFFEKYQNSNDSPLSTANPLEYLGTILSQHLEKTISPFMYDFPAKTELLNVFADFCADIGITVYHTNNSPEYRTDLFLTKKSNAIFTVTESVFARTGSEINIDNYEQLLGDIARSSLIAEWKVFITTPAAVLKIGFEKMKSDMKRLNTWFYVISPRQKQIFGIIKGNKSKAIDITLQGRFIDQLPHTPIRSPSQVISLSRYEFSERKAYKPKTYQLYNLTKNLGMELIEQNNQYCSNENLKSKFKSLLLIDKQTGLTLYSFSKENVEDQMISGFLSAMDSFVKQFSGSSNMEEINYQGFMINAGEGQQIRSIAILSEPTSRAFKERLQTFTVYFEKKFAKEISDFARSGEKPGFKGEEIDDLICNLLAV